MKNHLIDFLMQETKVIKRIFNLLNDWRKLPAYQLERRVDIYFALHLEKVFKEKFSEEILAIIPEFPIRKGSIDSGDTGKDNQSFKVDYAVFTKNKESKKIYLIELKTDNGSIRKSQTNYYKATIKAGAERILSGLIEVFYATKAKKKYKHLLDKLVSVKALEYSCNEYFSTSEFEFYKEPIFIKPSKTSDDPDKVTYLHFNEIADLLSDEKDELTIELVKSLREWGQSS